jgi:thiosulfate sulfurtransferase
MVDIRMDSFKHINTQQAQELISQGAALADIRDEESFNNSHIRNAQHLANHNFQEFLESSDLDLPLVLYCYHGNSSQSAAQYLIERGFEQVYSLNGGFEAWQTTFPEHCSRS